MKAFKLYKSYYSFIKEEIVKEALWTEALKKDVVKILDDAQKKTVCSRRINEYTLLVHATSNNVSMDFVYTVEEVTI